MNFSKLKKIALRSAVLLLFSAVLQGCVVGNVAGSAVGATIEVIKIPFKVAGAAVDAIIPDDEC